MGGEEEEATEEKGLKEGDVDATAAGLLGETSAGEAAAAEAADLLATTPANTSQSTEVTEAELVIHSSNVGDDNLSVVHVEDVHGGSLMKYLLAPSVLDLSTPRTSFVGH